MTASAWLVIGICGLSLFVIFLGIAVFLFIQNKIPKIMGDLSGKNARKQIKEIREENVKSGIKKHTPGEVNLGRGTITEMVKSENKEPSIPKFDIAAAHASKRLDISEAEQKKENSPSVPVQTQGNYNGVTNATTVLPDTQTTDVLSDSNATTILSENHPADSNATTILSENQPADSNATTILSENQPADSNATTILSENQSTDYGTTTVLSSGSHAYNQNDKSVSDFKFVVVQSIVCTHTDETIS